MPDITRRKLSKLNFHTFHSESDDICKAISIAKSTRGYIIQHCPAGCVVGSLINPFCFSVKFSEIHDVRNKPHFSSVSIAIVPNTELSYYYELILINDAN